MKTTLASILAVLIVTFASTAHAQSVPALGVRGGALQSPDHLYLGLQTELTRVLDGGVLAPSIDFALDDGAPVVLHGDVRWYLFRLPETGLRFYGAIGPGITLQPDTDIGLELTAGLNVPMRDQRRYNVELRFGFGDVPEFGFGLAILFGLR